MLLLDPASNIIISSNQYDLPCPSRGKSPSLLSLSSLLSVAIWKIFDLPFMGSTIGLPPSEDAPGLSKMNDSTYLSIFNHCFSELKGAYSFSPSSQDSYLLPLQQGPTFKFGMFCAISLALLCRQTKDNLHIHLFILFILYISGSLLLLP